MESMIAHPLEEASGSKGIRFLESHPDFPSNGKPDASKGQIGIQPRLLEVHDITGFAFNTDCSSLSALDAMMTVLYNYNPSLLNKFFDYKTQPTPRGGFDYKPYGIYFRRSSDKEKFDIEISRTSNKWHLRLYAKDSKDEIWPDMQATYSWGESDDVKEWKPKWLLGTAFGKLKELENEQQFEKYAKRLARYVLLLRPWEERDGVKIQVRREESPGGKEVEFDSHAVDMKKSEPVRIKFPAED